MERAGEELKSPGARAAVLAAAAACVRPRLEEFRRAAAAVAESKARRAGKLRKLRVAARRAEVAMRLVPELLEEPSLRKLRRRIRRLRRGAGGVRDLLLQRAMLSEAASGGQDDRPAAVSYLAGRLNRDLRGRARELCRALAQRRGGLGGRVDAVLDGMERPTPSGVAAGIPPVMAALAGPRLSTLAAEARQAAAADLVEPPNLHALRIALKRLRFGLELFAACWPSGEAAALLERMRSVQTALGEVNDLSVMAARVADEQERAAKRGGRAAAVAPELGRLAAEYASRREQLHTEVLAAMGTEGAAAIADEVVALLDALPASQSETAAPHDTGGGGNGVASRPSSAPATNGVRRLAALDIGTNSVRLAVVEAHPDGAYRVIDDEKETTRLGRGLIGTGRLSPESMEHSATAIARMRQIAEGYGVGPGSIRIVGTSAVREAANRGEFIELVRQRAGVEVEVLSADDEGRLAFLSVAHCCDLSGINSAVVDIGGGSTEIVLAAGGVIEEVYSLPLGAVTLTERFGGPEACARERHKEMRRFIRKSLQRAIGRPPLYPQLVAGTGGTFAALGAMAAQQDPRRQGPLLWDRGSPGVEVTRPQIRHLTDTLRHLPQASRTAVQGLRADRADIIVAGLAIAERVLRFLGSNTVRVHDRGIRDGLVITMAAREFSRPTRGPIDPMRGVRRLAQACGYERAHTEHVTRLALQLHDQLAAALAQPEKDEEPPAWATLAGRRLLEAAGILHDIGYVVNYSGHHKHSYHLIVHSDLASGGPFTPREVEVIANIARYHRRADPKNSHPALRALAAEDRALVRKLSAILRVADGLDRTHTQQVATVRVEPGPGVAAFFAAAERDPATDLWGAARKSGLFERAFGLRPEFAWERALVDAGQPALIKGAAAS